MRVLSMIVLMTLFGASAVLLGEPQQENWSRCKSDDPDRKIGGCSAVIQSGQETGTNLANAFRGRGSAYAHKGDYDRAFQDYDQALKLNPSDAKAFYGRGTAYWHKGDFDRAFQDYDQGLRLNPSYANGFFGRGLVYEHKGDIDYAISDYDKALRLNPSLASAFYERGNAYALKGNYDHAIKDYDQGLRLGRRCERVLRPGCRIRQQRKLRPRDSRLRSSAAAKLKPCWCVL